MPKSGRGMKSKVSALLLVVVWANLSQAQDCPLIGAQKTIQSDWALRNCTVFRANACCSYAQVDLALGVSMAQAGLMVQGVDTDPEYATRNCRNHLDYLMCYFCSPLQKGWTEKNGKVPTCLSGLRVCQVPDVWHERVICFASECVCLVFGMSR